MNDPIHARACPRCASLERERDAAAREAADLREEVERMVQALHRRDARVAQLEHQLAARAALEA